MATSALAIGNAIKAAIDAVGEINRADPNCKVDGFIDAFATALYGELQNLEDTAGTPASPAHQ